MATYTPGDYGLLVTGVGPGGEVGQVEGALTVYATGVDLGQAKDFYQFQNDLRPTFTAAVGTAQENDQANQIKVNLRVSVNTAQEADAANSISFEADIEVDVNTASESDQANAFGILETVQLGAALESDTAYSIGYNINLELGQANESDAANAIVPFKPSDYTAPRHEMRAIAENRIMGVK